MYKIISKRQQIRKAVTIFTFLLFPVVIFYFSPYLIILGAMEGVIAGSFIMFSAMFLFSIFFGRSLCGYVCPVGGLQECLSGVNGNKTKGGWRNLIKYFIWVPWIAAIVVLFIRAGGVTGVDFFLYIDNGVSLGEPYTYIIYYGVLIIVTALSLAAGRRAFCHYLCWMAPFMVIGSKISDLLRLPRLRLAVKKPGCAGCGRCSAKCPMSLDVCEMINTNDLKNPECILCGECVDTCPKKLLKYSFRD